MKRIMLFLLVLVFATGAAQAQSLCTVRGRILDQAGQPVSKPQITVSGTQLVSGQYIVSRSSKTHTGDVNGYIAFTVFRDAVVHMKSNTMDSLYYGQLVYIPNVDSVQLTSLPIGSPAIPPRYVVAIASTVGIAIERGGALIGDSIPTVNFSNDFGVTESPTGTININIDTYRDSVQARINAINNYLYSISLELGAIESRLDTTGAAERAAIEADFANYQPLLTVEQQARIDSMIAAGVRVTITSVGKIRVISIDTTGFMLGDMYNNLVATVNSKLNSDTASIAAVMDAMYARSGGASVWTTGTGFVYRDGGVTIGGTESPWSYGGRTRIKGNVSSDKDSLWSTPTLIYPKMVRDSSAIITGDSAKYRLWDFSIGPFVQNSTANFSGRDGYAEFEIWWSYPNFDFSIVSDTTNGVYTTLIEIETKYDGAAGGIFNYSYPGAGRSIQTINQSSTSLPYSAAWHSSAAYWGGLAVQALPHTPLFRLNNCPFFSGSVNQGNRYAKIKVHFIARGSNTSSYYVKLANI